VVFFPRQIVLVPLIEVAGNEVSCTVILILLQIVMLFVPSARTKYVVLVEGAKVILAPVPTKVPPHDDVYHFQLAPVPRLPPLTDRVVLLPLFIKVVPLIEVAGTDVS
jgi:hypothetical protein